MIPLRIQCCFALSSRRCRSSGLGVKTNRVVLHKLLHVAVSPASVEVVFLHLGIYLIVVPVVVIESVNGAHDACAVPSAGAVHIELPS